MKKVAAKLIQNYAAEYDLDQDVLWFVYTIGLKDEIREVADETAKACGFKQIKWIQANGVITTHGGPAAFGIAGFAR